MTSLKCCPFCGHTPNSGWWGRYSKDGESTLGSMRFDTFWCVSCVCGAKVEIPAKSIPATVGQSDLGKAREIAVEAWNRRVTQ